MNYSYPFFEEISLHVPGRISAEDAKRQERTAKEILKRLSEQPGLILADEVGMGKTFVALAVAVSVALADPGKRPIVVMVPPSLKEKWPADFDLFREKCLPKGIAEGVRYGRAERAVEFLKFLDDPPERQKQILFVTHGAMSRGLSDGWVKLALIYQALRGRWGTNQIKKALSRILGKLLWMTWAEKNGQDIWQDLLTNHPSEWLRILLKWGIDPENDKKPETDDDPVPRTVYELLPHLDTNSIWECVKGIPIRRSKNLDNRIKETRQAIAGEIRTLWKECVRSLRIKLPLLILDEAHHLKNPETQLASLFQISDAHEDAEEIARGPLEGVFERMLFLTATPFQLGHGELCSVLERFNGISWTGKLAPRCGRDGYSKQLEDLRTAIVLPKNWTGV